MSLYHPHYASLPWCLYPPVILSLCLYSRTWGSDCAVSPFLHLAIFLWCVDQPSVQNYTLAAAFWALRCAQKTSNCRRPASSLCFHLLHSSHPCTTPPASSHPSAGRVCSESVQWLGSLLRILIMHTGTLTQEQSNQRTVHESRKEKHASRGKEQVDTACTSAWYWLRRAGTNKLLERPK